MARKFKNQTKVVQIVYDLRRTMTSIPPGGEIEGDDYAYAAGPRGPLTELKGGARVASKTKSVATAAPVVEAESGVVLPPAD